MNCDQARALLGPASDNELPNDSAAMVQGHLGECAKCQSEWEEILTVRAGLHHLVSAQQPEANFEKRIMQGIQNDQKASRLKRSSMILIGLAASISLLVVVASNLNFTIAPILSASNRASGSDTTVSIENLVAGVGHHSSSSSDHGFKLDYVGKKDAQQLTPVAGFKVREIQLANYSLYGSDLVKIPSNRPNKISGQAPLAYSDGQKLLVRMCYTSKDHSTDECIDCYQAPSGMMAFQKTSLERVAMNNGQTASVGKFDGQSVVMVSSNGSDILYVSPISADQLLALVNPAT